MKRDINNMTVPAHPGLLRLPAFCLVIILLCSYCSERPSIRGKEITEDSKLDTETTGHELKADTEEAPVTIDAIKKTYAMISKKFQDGELDSTSFKYDCNGEKGGTVSYFSDKGKLRMVVHRYHEYDHYSAVDRYFVKDSTVFFAHLTSISWAFEDGSQGTTRDNIKEQRTYLIKQEPVRCLEKKYTLRSDARNNPAPDSVPNNEVGCQSVKPLLSSYALLVKYQHKSAPHCLE